MILSRFGRKLLVSNMISGITVLILGIAPIAAYAQNNNFNQTLVETAIRAIYTEVLGRNADDNGLRGYTESVRNNRLSLAQVRQQITNSPEADQAIRHNYQQAHGRAPDPNQLRDVKHSIENGSRLDQIRTPIADNSQNNNFNQTLVETAIRTIYTEVLGRNADDNGLRGYTDSVRNNRLSLAQVRQQITNSPEADQAIRHNYQLAHGNDPNSNQLRDAKHSIENGSRLDQIRR